MNGIANGENLTDEDWFVHQAKVASTADIFLAKSWLITAKTFYPRSFVIQFAAYNLEKNEGNFIDAAKCLEEMWGLFSQEKELIMEMDNLVAAGLDSKDEFLKKIFNRLPENLQCSLLMDMASNATQVEQQVQLSIHLIKKYPEKMAKEGMKLIELLISAEKKNSSSPVNMYRKYLVCCVLPVMLTSTHLEIPSKHYIRWIQKAIEFYISYIYLESGSEQLDETIGQPWQDLFCLMRESAKVLDWKIGSLFTNLSLETEKSQLEGLLQLLERKPDSHAIQKQILYCTIVLQFYSLHLYLSNICPFIFSNSTAADLSNCHVFVERIQARPCRNQPPKKKVKPQLPDIEVISSELEDSQIALSFKTAFTCYQAIQQNDLTKEYNKLMQHWRADLWAWLEVFWVDSLLYQGDFHDAITKLVAKKSTAPNSKLQNSLQLATCYFQVGDNKKMYSTIYDILSSLTIPEEGLEIADYPVRCTADLSGRTIHILPCTINYVLPYCVQLVIEACHALCSNKNSVPDIVVGHLIVLSQFNWPRYQSFFQDAIESIEAAGTFTYQMFFTYVTNLEILEEFAYLNSRKDAHIRIDILPSKNITPTRTVTRGINKGAQEGFRQALEKQIKFSNDNNLHLIKKFLLEQNNSLLDILS